MRGVDLARWRFDWDLTFAMVAARPDGQVLHRYGGRDARGADHWLNVASLKAFLQAGLESYRSAAADAGKLGPSRSLDEVPPFAIRDKGACIHCHSVNPALRIEAQQAGTWTRASLWTYPAPARIGLDLHAERQTEVITVEPGSVAAKAGVRVGDRLARLGEARLATASDLMAALHALPPAATPTTIHVVRGDGQEPVALAAQLPSGWKVAPPEDFAWRPSKWGLSPAPGFGGPVLDPGELRELGLKPSVFAFRVSYLVNWGENKRWGQRAAAAGIAKGQVVLGAGGKRDFASIDHFHAWWRLTRKAGESVPVTLWEGGEEREIPLPVGE